MLKKFIFFLIIISLIQASFSINQSFTFTDSSTIIQPITFTSYPLTTFSFTIKGEQSSSSYPTNVTINIGDDSDNEWSYKPYHSATPEKIEKIYYITPTQKSDIYDRYFLSGESNGTFGTLLGSIQNSNFVPSSNQNLANLAIITSDNLYKNTYSIITNNQTLHVFTPTILSALWSIGLYVAKGGSTYYCNSDHSFVFSGNCDLSPAQALTPSHLAKQAPDSDPMDFSEFLPSTVPLLNEINQHLSVCSTFPCTINFSVTSQSAGIIELQNILGATSINPPNIMITDSGANYDISITSDDTLTNVESFYGDIPNVIIVPTIANDETQSLTNEQIAYLNNIKDTLANKWDALTQNKHPLNFTFFNQTINIINYSKVQNNQTEYFRESIDQIKPLLTQSESNIIIILDIMDYFPSQDPYNSKSSFENGVYVIGNIYMNGFTPASFKTSLTNYDSEIVYNILLHELAHSFIYYSGDTQYFYSDHPASYSSLTEFPTYLPSNSPTTQEAYYELYSVLNQIRPYLLDSEIGKSIELSPIDKMFLGTLTVHSGDDYNLYSTQISKSGNEYTLSSITQSPQILAKSIYETTSSPFWNIKTSSQKTSQGTSSTFSIPKTSQNNKALFIIAEDNTYQNHFEVFSNNAQSTSNILNSSVFNLDIENPSQVQNLFFSNIQTTSLTLSWSAATDNIIVSHYNIYRDNIYLTETSSLAYINSNLQENTQYSYQVSAVDNSSNEGLKSTAIIVTTNTTLDIENPSQVQNLTSSNIQTASLTLNWSSATDNIIVTHYNIYRDNIYLVNTSSLTYTNLNLQENTQYSYQVSAVDNSLNEGLRSTSLSVTTAQDTYVEDGGGAGGGGGGGSGSSSKDDSKEDMDVESEKEEEKEQSPPITQLIGGNEEIVVCDLSSIEQDWGLCKLGKQSRNIIDLNNCQILETETKDCNENLKLENAKKLNLKKNENNSNIYYTKLNSSPNGIFYLEETTNESLFLIIDEDTNEKYLGKFIQSENGRNYYVLEQVDNTSNIEQDNSEKTKYQNLYENLLISFAILFSMLICVLIYRLLKK
jgi:chitodextrinase